MTLLFSSKISRSIIPSPKQDMLLEESLPITFAEIAPPIDICSPPGTEYKVNLCFFSSFTTSLILAPTSISINFFFFIY